MAETVETPEAPAQPVQQQAQEPVGNPGAQNTLEAIGSFLDPKTRGELQALANGKAPATEAPAPAAPETPPAGQPAAGQPAAEDKKDPPAAPAPAGQPAQEEKKSVLGLTKKKAEASKNEIVIETPDQIIPVIKSKFGQELKDIKELPKFFEAADKWRADAQKYETVNKQHTQLLSEIESLPPEFGEAFERLARGEDYKAPFVQAAPKFDFKIPADKQDEKALVDHYLPGKFTEADFKDKSPALELAISLSKEKYNLEVQSLDKQRAEKVTTSQKRQEAYSESLKGSVQSLQQAFPEMDADALKEVSAVFEGGPAKVMSFFFNPDGTLKPAAAKTLVLGMHGESEIQRMMGIASNITETKLNEELLTRGSDGPAPVKSRGNQDTVSEEAKEKIAEYEKLGQASGGKRTY